MQEVFTAINLMNRQVQISCQFPFFILLKGQGVTAEAKANYSMLHNEIADILFWG